MTFPTVNCLVELATVKRFLMAFLLNNLIRFAAMPWFHSRWMPDGSPDPLDLKFAYSASEAAAQIRAFTDAGRAGYRMFLLTVDVIYPIAYTVTFVWAIALLKLQSRWEKSTIAVRPAVAAFGFDMLENMTISWMLTVYPEQPATLGWMASIFTTLKWLSVVATIATILLLILARLQANKGAGKRGEH